VPPPGVSRAIADQVDTGKRDLGCDRRGRTLPMKEMTWALFFFAVWIPSPVLGGETESSVSRFQEVVRGCQDRDEEVRLDAVFALREFSSRRAAVLRLLVATARRDPSWRVRRTALDALLPFLTVISSKEISKEIAKVLVSDREPRVRWSAATILLMLHHEKQTAVDVPAVLRALAAALADSEVEVRRTAALAIGTYETRDHRLARAVSAALLTDTDLKVRRYAALSLGAVDPTGKDTLRLLLPLLKHEDTEMRLCAVAGLGNGRFRARSAIPAIRPFLFARDREMRAEAAHALGQIGVLTRLDRRLLALLLADEDREVRATASEALWKARPAWGFWWL
jgi:HEAT repeat protein